MKVAALMTEDVVTIDANDTVDDALALLDEQHIRHLPVLTEGRVVGIVSDRALAPYRMTLRQLLADPQAGAASLKTPVSEAAAAELISVASHESVHDAIATMLQQQVSVLPVLDEGRLVGILSWVDVLQGLRDGQLGAAEQRPE